MKLYSLLVIFALCCACSSKTTPTQRNISKELIGKKFVKISDLDSNLSSGAFITLSEDSRYSLSLYYSGDSLYKNDVFAVLTMSKGYQGNLPVDSIIDVITINRKLFTDAADVRLNECNLEDKADYSTVAIYDVQSAMESESVLHPLKAWHPDLGKGKLVEVENEKLKCKSPEDIEE
jgi:hypothetical protein